MAGRLGIHKLRGRIGRLGEIWTRAKFISGHEGADFIALPGFYENQRHA